MGIGNNPRGQEAANISAAFSVIGSLVVLCRLYIRFILVKCSGAEDVCIAVALLFSIAFTILVKVQADAGLGIHVWKLTNEELLGPLKSLFASIICYYLAFAFIKGSILFQYHRIFQESRVSRMIYILGAIVFVYSIETVLATIFLCIPVQKFWEPSIPGSCANKRVLWFTNSALHIATDFAIVILPLPVLKNLNLPRQQKRALIFVFAIGGFACAVSILRLRSLVKVTTSTDLTYDNADTATWSAGELNISLICACLPALRPVFSRLLPAIFATSDRSITEDHFKMSSRRGATGGGSRLRTAENPFDSGELTDQQKRASDDMLPLQSKCWAHRRPEQDDIIENAQIMVLTDVHQRVANRM